MIELLLDAADALLRLAMHPLLMLERALAERGTRFHASTAFGGVMPPLIWPDPEQLARAEEQIEVWEPDYDCAMLDWRRRWDMMRP